MAPRREAETWVRVINTFRHEEIGIARPYSPGSNFNNYIIIRIVFKAKRLVTHTHLDMSEKLEIVIVKPYSVQ